MINRAHPTQPCHRSHRTSRLNPVMHLGGLLAVVMACVVTVSSALAGSYDDFFIAIKRDLPQQVALLLKRGFDPNTIDPERGETGLILALREDHAAIADLLMKAQGIDLEAKARNGDTALMIAAFKQNKAVVQALIALEAEVNRPGWTALHYAASVGANEIVQLLLEASAYIDAESPNQTTALMMAARGGHILTVKLLLDEGADATLKNDQGMSAIDLARKFNHSDIVDGLTYRLRRAGKLQ